MPTIAFLELNEPLWVYITIPFAAAFIGYVTKLLMIEMIFRPLEFKGLIDPWLGWQGQVPRKAAKMASVAIETLQGGLLKPEELIDRIDVDDLVAQLEEPLAEAIDEITEEIGSTYQPRVWAVMPESTKRALKDRIQAQSGPNAHRILAEVREHLDQLFDLKHTVVTTLVRDKAKLVRLFRSMGDDTFAFMRRAGLLFGLYIGVIQTAALIVTGEALLLPLFGLLTGGVTDWLALQMIFRPVKPGRFLGLRWQGRFHSRRVQITRDYSAMMAEDILTPATILEGVLTGPMSDRLFALIEREVHTAIDEQAPTLARPLLTATMRDGGYAEMKALAARRVLERMHADADLVGEYAARSLNLQEFLAERMDRMTDDQYENLLRPVFKEDEWIVVVLGCALGFAFGELQMHFLLGH